VTEHISGHHKTAFGQKARLADNVVTHPVLSGRLHLLTGTQSVVETSAWMSKKQTAG